MRKTICSTLAGPSALEMAALCSVPASLLGGRLQAVANNKAIEATITAANIANAARIGTQTLIGTNPAHQNNDSFRKVHSALREGITALSALDATSRWSAPSDEDHVRDERRLSADEPAVWLGKKGKWRCSARGNNRASCSTSF